MTEESRPTVVGDPVTEAAVARLAGSLCLLAEDGKTLEIARHTSATRATSRRTGTRSR